MPRIIWTPNAALCIKRLHDFLKEKNPDAAKRAVRAIRTGIKPLKKFPNSGKPVEHLDGEVRTYMISFGSRGYTVLYKNEGNNSYIISVKHYLELDFIVQ